MLTKDMLSILCCPTCREKGLREDIKRQEKDEIKEGFLVCDTCNASYPVHSGVPDFIPYSVLDAAEWKLWKNHLEYFQSRRESRQNKPAQDRLTNPSRLHNAFFDFAGIDSGAVLDVGCGPGKLRFYLNENKVTYYGLDPIPLNETQNFKYVRALAEYIPYQDSIFSHMVVISSLDHFQNLDSFFKESSRVLKADGVLHLLQSIHGESGLLSGCKNVLHLLKDNLDERRTRKKDSNAPKHMSEFTTESLLNISRSYFEVLSTKKFYGKWYAPSKLFISMKPIH